MNRLFFAASSLSAGGLTRLDSTPSRSLQALPKGVRPMTERSCETERPILSESFRTALDGVCSCLPNAVEDQRDAGPRREDLDAGGAVQ